MKDGIFAYVKTVPLMTPQTTPTSGPTISPSAGLLMPTRAVTTHESPTTEPTDRSIDPDTTTNVMPKATIARTTDCCAITSRFEGAMNVAPFNTVNRTKSAIRARNGTSCRTREPRGGGCRGG